MQFLMHKVSFEGAKLGIGVTQVALRVLGAALLHLQQVSQTADLFALFVRLRRSQSLRSARSLMMLDNNLPFLNEATTTLIRERFFVANSNGPFISLGP
ncbi:hypothetical protein [Asaia krungthepensis]|uniref:Uncharacterized protein n=1 Tax=Asaia krungthepensis NRIC 0535 TaxID=1307925 RepID=A0ABQ0Q1Y2_9PROT|nr:hypothetical protein [Asaia krungthepensis]GBQ87511.1 hypothetical protein AA0535_1299 [Asaia krungthepensis NRIC 0535]